MGKWTNLATRKSDGIMVTLDFRYCDEISQLTEIRVTVNRTDKDEDFILYPPNDRALDCYYHPFAFADRLLMAGRADHVTHGQ